MPSRRQFLLTAATVGAMPALGACSSGPTYEEAAQALWRHDPAPAREHPAAIRALVRYATLAPSSHNSQCWRFHARRRDVVIEPDLARRCPAVDPDDHHVFVSLGCAAENLSLAALAHGFVADGRFDASGRGSYALTLTRAAAVRTPLFEAIPARQCTRGDYDGRALSREDLRQLEQAAAAPGVRLILLTGRSAMEKVLEYVVAGNTTQMNDAAFVDELTAWIRFSEAEAVRTGDGLFAGASGNPSVPRWLGRALMGLFFTVDSENDRYARQVRNSAGVAVFVGERADAAHWVEVGRSYERFALQATALGIRNAMLNQPVEVPAVRRQFASWLQTDGPRPDLVVRFGRGPRMPVSLRRPVDAVLT